MSMMSKVELAFALRANIRTKAGQLLRSLPLFLTLVACGTCWAHQAAPPGAGQPPSPEQLDKLLAPIALYPDALVGQILTCSTSPFQVSAFSDWLSANSNLKGSELQAAAQQEGFDPSFVALAVFPQVVTMMTRQMDWTKMLGQAFQSDRKSVFDSIQRLRTQAEEVGNLTSTPQQEVQQVTTDSGQQIIVIQPANPQVVYVPQYNPQTVYSTPPPPAQTASAPQQQSGGGDGSAIAAGVIGFTAGVIIGAVASDNYYSGPYAWRGGAAMYHHAWDDYYDHREDMLEDRYDFREDAIEDRQDISSERQDTRSQNVDERSSSRSQNVNERQTTSSQNVNERQSSRDQSQASRQSTRSGAQATAQGTTSRASAGGQATASTRSSSDASRGRSPSSTSARSSAFSGYGSASKERAASSRGRASKSSSKSTRGRRK